MLLQSGHPITEHVTVITKDSITLFGQQPAYFEDFTAVIKSRLLYTEHTRIRASGYDLIGYVVGIEEDFSIFVVIDILSFLGVRVIHTRFCHVEGVATLTTSQKGYTMILLIILEASPAIFSPKAFFVLEYILYLS